MRDRDGLPLQPVGGDGQEQDVDDNHNGGPLGLGHTHGLGMEQDDVDTFMEFFDVDEFRERYKNSN